MAHVLVAFWMHCKYLKAGKTRIWKPAAISFTAKHEIWIFEILVCNLVVDAWNEKRKIQIGDPFISIHGFVSAHDTCSNSVLCVARQTFFLRLPWLRTVNFIFVQLFEFILSRLLKLNNFRWDIFWRKTMKKVLNRCSISSNDVSPARLISLANDQQVPFGNSSHGESHHQLCCTSFWNVVVIEYYSM